MGTLIWFIIAIVLGLAELAAGEFTLLMLAGAALITAGVSLVGLPLWAEVVVFAVSALALVLFVRPILKRRLLQPKVLDTSAKALIGQRSEVIEPITKDGGKIKLDGSIWTAQSVDSTVEFAVGDYVTVVRIDGATAVVWKEV